MTPTTVKTSTRDSFARRVDWSSIAVVAVLLGIGAGIGAGVATEHERVSADDWAHLAATSAPIAAEVDPVGVPSPAAGATALPGTVDTSHLELTAGTLVAGAPHAVPPGPRAAADWVLATAHATGIPAVALRAYADASLVLGVEQPGCRLGWSTLAAIGGIESGHGTHGGSALREDGTTTVPIVGPALDGRPGFAAIRATAQSTGWHDAVFSYNHSEQYVADVLGGAKPVRNGLAGALSHPIGARTGEYRALRDECDIRSSSGRQMWTHKSLVGP